MTKSLNKIMLDNINGIEGHPSRIGIIHNDSMHYGRLDYCMTYTMHSCRSKISRLCIVTCIY